MTGTAGAEWVDAWFRFHPEQASAKGYRRYDARAPSFEDEDLAAFDAAIERARAALPSAAERRRLPPEQRVDVALLAGHVETAGLAIREQAHLVTNPLLYVGGALESIESLELRAEAGDEAARRALPARLAGVAPLMDRARARLDAPEEPFRTTALSMLEDGIEHLAERFGRASAGEELRQAAAAARRAFERLHAHLDANPRDVRPFAPMGPGRYGRLLVHEHGLDPDPTPWVELARRTVDELRDAAAAAPPDPGPPPAGFGPEAVRAARRSEVEAVRELVLRRDLVTIPEGRLVLREVPRWMEALIAGGFYLPPPAFSGPRIGWFFMPRVPDRMDEEQRVAWHQRLASRRFRNLVAHEVWPGHHVQFLHAVRHPSALRRYRDDDVMVEGWAMYCEELMAEQGLWDGVPVDRPVRPLLFRALRVLIDAGLHRGELGLGDAVDLLVGAFGEGSRGWAEVEVRRYAAEPTQAMSYLVGRRLLLDLRAELRGRLGPRFELKRFHDAVLAEGSIPLPQVRAALLART